MDDMLRVGVLTSTHGLKGEAKVFVTSDEHDRFETLSHVWAVSPTGLKKNLEIEHVRYFKNLAILKFKGINKIEDIQPMMKWDLMVDREDALELEEDEYFVTDLMGLKVVTEDGEDLGEITDVLTGTANDVYVVTKGKDELLIPAIHEVVKEVDLEEGVMTVELMEGMR